MGLREDGMLTWGRNVVSSHLPGPAASPPPAPILMRPETLHVEQKPTGLGLRVSDDYPSGLQSHIPSLTLSVGPPGWGEAPGEGQTGRAHPAKSHPTRQSLRAQAPWALRGLSLHQAELTAGQVLYIEWNLLDTALRINFFSLFKDGIKIILHSIKGKC